MNQQLQQFSIKDERMSNEQVDDDNQCDGGFVVRMRGLPWSATTDDIINFLNMMGEAKVKGGSAGIHLTMNRGGRPSGEAYVEMESEDDLKAALKKDREHMGNRYIEVYESNRSEMEWVIKRTGLTLGNVLGDNVVRLRGIPFESTKDDIIQFFKGLEIIPDGITIATNFTGRSTGDAFVQLVDRENTEKALQKHKEKIGYRYIEVFRSSLREIRNQALQKSPRNTPYDRMDRYGGDDESSGGDGSGGRYIDTPIRAGRNIKSFENNNYDKGDGPWNNGRNIGGPNGEEGQRMRGGGRGWNVNKRNTPPNRPFFVVHMRGLPYKANENDIATFFDPFDPIEVTFLYNNDNRPSGEAKVEFGTKEDAIRAMSKDKTFMQHRYIELFMDGPGAVGNNNYSMDDDIGPPNAGNDGNFGRFKNNLFQDNSGRNSFGKKSFFKPKDNSGPLNSFFSDNMGDVRYPRSSGLRTMSGPGLELNSF